MRCASTRFGVMDTRPHMTDTARQLAQFHALQTSIGQSLLAEIHQAEPTSQTSLAIATRLRKSYDPDLVATAMTLHELRTRAATKFPGAERMYFTRAGYEQASAAAIAKHRTERYAGARHIADLCCGIGGDLISLTGVQGVADVLAVDLDPVHLAIAEANVDACGNADTLTTMLADVRDVDMTGIDAVFIDPARRDDNRRTGPGASEPPLGWSLALAERVSRVGVKTAPGVSEEVVPPGWERELISLGSDLKEAVLWSPTTAQAERTATVIEGEAAWQLRPVDGQPVPVVVPEPGMWLLDPNPAVTRAGLVQDLARHVGAAPIDEQIAFLVAPKPVTGPFARIRRILASVPWHERSLKRLVRELGGGSVDIRRRGLAGDPNAIARRLRGRGERRLMIAMTRHRNEPWAIICEDAPERR